MFRCHAYHKMSHHKNTFLYPNKLDFANKIIANSLKKCTWQKKNKKTQPFTAMIIALTDVTERFILVGGV